MIYNKKIVAKISYIQISECHITDTHKKALQIMEKKLMENKLGITFLVISDTMTLY